MLNDCVFCQIVKKEISAKIIYEDEETIAFLDVNPISTGHVLVIPKQHYDNFSSCNKSAAMNVAATSLLISQRINEILHPAGMNFLSNENNIAGQEVMHYHVNVIPKYKVGLGFSGVEKRAEHLADNLDQVYAQLSLES